MIINAEIGLLLEFEKQRRQKMIPGDIGTALRIQELFHHQPTILSMRQFLVFAGLKPTEHIGDPKRRRLQEINHRIPGNHSL